MKLSEMTVKESRIKILKLLPLIKTIAKDKELTSKMFKKIDISAGMTELEIKEVKYNYNVDKAFSILEMFLEKYEKQLFTIISVIHDVEPLEVENWTLSQLSESIMDILADEGFSRLFMSAVK